MPLGVRIFLVYFLFVGLTGYFVLSTVMDEVRPGVRQSTEETLVDTANLLAEILRQDVKNGTLAQSDLPEMLEDYGKRVPQADIWGLRKEAVNHRIYVTDASGKVLLDSAGVAVGQDYSRWNDVYLTLRGQYGARSSREDPDDPDSSVMYVAAPIKDAGKIIGVVSVAKPNSSLQPYIDRSQRRLAWLGAGLIDAALPGEACAAAPVIGVLDLQCGADQLQGMRVLRPAVLQRHAGVVLAVDDGEGDLAARFFQAPAGPGALADIQFEAQAAGVEVRRGDPHRAVAADFVGDGFDAAVADIAHQYRGEQAAGAVPGLGAEQVALGELPGVRRAQLQSLQHLGAGLPDEAVPAFQHAT
ncbi:hypothetical protein K3Z88_12985, partial [Pseudomonas aeruginosa]|nr:hypothetical protein [Pseudomonas aeruginosa]